MVEERNTVKVLYSGGVRYVPVLAAYANALKFNKGTRVTLALSGNKLVIERVERKTKD